ncbi:MAG: tetratricopeptide repeat protein [Bacteroidales bacterium]
MAKQQAKKIKQKNQQGAGFWDIVTRVPFIYLVFFLLAFIIYGQVLKFYLGKFDEDLLILGNLNMLKDLANLKMAFLRDAFLSQKGVSFYRPLQTVTYMIDAQFFHARGSVFYVTNILLHAAACSALFYLLTLLGNNRKAAFIFTLLYLASPLFVHAIAWAPSRGDLLIGLTGLLSMVFFIKMAATGEFKYGIFTLLAFLAAMFSKETAILIPVMILLYYIFLEKERKLPLVSLLLLAAGFLVIIVLYFYMRSQVVKLSAPPAEFGLGPLVHNLRTLPEYIGKFFIPFNLSPMAGFTVLSTLLGLVLLAALVILSFRFTHKPYTKVLFGFTWFLIFFIPGAMYSHKLGGAAYNYLEHRAYLPMAGIIMMLFFIFDGIPEGRVKSRMADYTMVLALILGIYAFIYTGNYENPMVFYNHAISSNPASALALSNRGLIKADLKDFKGAVADYEKAVAIKPDYAQAYVNKGISLAALNDYAGAIEQYNTAVGFEPGLFQAHFNKANAQVELGLFHEALKEYDLSVDLFPTFAQAYTARGMTYYRLQNFPEAEKDYTSAIRLNDKLASAYTNRGKIRFNNHDRDAACTDWKAAATLGDNEANELLGKYCK